MHCESAKVNTLKDIKKETKIKFKRKAAAIFETFHTIADVRTNNRFDSSCASRFHFIFDQLYVHTALAMLTFPTISTLGGSPIAVAVPPMLENRTSAMRICIGSNPKASLNL